MDGRHQAGRADQVGDADQQRPGRQAQGGAGGREGLARLLGAEPDIEVVATWTSGTSKEIAARLSLSESAVKAVLQQLFDKAGVRTRSQLVRVALEQYPDLL